MKYFYLVWQYLSDLFQKKKSNSQFEVNSNEQHDTLYERREDFPTMGMLGNFYVDKHTASVYTWDGKDYVLVTDVQSEAAKLPTMDSMARGGFKRGEIVVFAAGNRPRYKSHLAPYMLKEQIHHISKELPEL